MTLYELKNIIDFTFDIADDEIDASFYIDLDEIPEAYSSQIEVVKIRDNLIVCRLTDFLRHQANFHPGRILKYLNENYYDGDQKEYLKTQLTKRKKDEDITDDGGEAVYQFIDCDLYDYLTTPAE